LEEVVKKKTPSYHRAHKHIHGLGNKEDVEIDTVGDVAVVLFAAANPPIRVTCHR
jgi:hypothetical protein